MPSLNWIGRDAVERHHTTVPFHLLHADPECSVGDPNSGNLLVEGDNLLALKALLPYYGRQVKCVYIDPPYNTGNEGWMYNDNVTSPQISQWLGQVVGKQNEDLSRHDKWLCMMYPRLVLLWQFLRNDGSIWVSIDDSEVHSMRMLLDEICGRDKFVACNVWQKRYSRENREAIGDVHEYIIVYAKSPELFKATRNKVPLDAKSQKVYKNPNKDPQGPWRLIPITAQAGHATPDQFYEIVSPSGKIFTPPSGRCWGLAKATFDRLNAEGKIYFGKKGNSQPSLIRYLWEVEGLVPWTWWPHDEVGHTDESKKELYSILGKEIDFENPKPTRLIKRILQIATNPGDLILDSFAGSGTTGHATLQLAKDRKFILVEMEPHIAKSVTAERLRRVIQGHGDIQGIGGGFQYCDLGKTLFDAEGRIRSEVSFDELARFVYFKATGTALPQQNSNKTPLLGIHNGTGIYLLYNGILKDKSFSGGNALTRQVLASLPSHEGSKIIYGTRCLLGDERLRRESITCKHIPTDLQVD